jgi:hypothetical protein
MTKKDRVWPKSESRNNGSIGDRRDNSSPEVLSRNSVSPSRKSAAGKARPEPGRRAKTANLDARISPGRRMRTSSSSSLRALVGKAEVRPVAIDR